MEERILDIDALAAGGDGIGRDSEGRVVFVPFAAPGDRVRVVLERTRRRHAHGRLLEVLEPGPARTSPRCPAFGRCGGCSWQHVDYPAQLAAKAAILRDALVRIGGLEMPEPPAIAPSPRAYGYRGRARVHVEGGRVGYRMRGSRELCAVQGCPVLLPLLDARLAVLASEPPAEAGDWELSSDGEQVRCAPLGRAGAAKLTLRVADSRVSFSTGVFAQSNALLLDLLVERVSGAAGAGDHVIELYAGAGLFTLRLARSFAAAITVEGSAEALADQRANLAEAGLQNVDVRSGDVARALPRLAGAEPDALVLDPPRTGLPPGGAAALAAIRARRVAYLSCDPATLARDLRVLCAGGYRLARVEGFDLFPQTPHVEALALLERVGS